MSDRLYWIAGKPVIKYPAIDEVRRLARKLSNGNPYWTYHARTADLYKEGEK